MSVDIDCGSNALKCIFENAGNLTFRNYTTITNARGLSAIYNTGTLTFDQYIKGEFVGARYGLVNDGGTVSITGYDVSISQTSDSDGYAAINNSGYLNILDGTVSGTNHAIINTGTVDINGGTFDGDIVNNGTMNVKADVDTLINNSTMTVNCDTVDSLVNNNGAYVDIQRGTFGSFVNGGSASIHFAKFGSIQRQRYP